MIQEAVPLWRRYDALLSVVFGPAPRLDRHDALNFWAKPNANPMANVLGCPSLALCNGFSTSGLPLGMQLMGRPFDEPTLLRIGHSYEQATEWHTRKPELVPGAPQPALAPQRHEPQPPSTLTQSQIDLVRALIGKAGLRLDDRQTALVLEAAPYALAMADRVRRMHERSLEPCNVFRFPAEAER
jgi:aspartyl-tRNA(Asn)/glutamyl-tRNA(Gln) amidotransferase subunit A